MLKSRISKIQALLALFVLVFANVVFLPTAFATNLTQSTVLFTNMNTGGAGSLVVAFKTSASNTGTGFTVQLSGWTGSGGTGTIATATTVATSNLVGASGTDCESLTSATAHLPGAITYTDTVASGLITFNGMTALTANTAYCIVAPAAIVANPTGAGTGTATITAGTDAAQAVTYDIISNDQVVVSATVPQSFTLALGGNTDNFGALSSGSVNVSPGVTMTVTTNAVSGWFLEGEDLNEGLSSATNGHKIAETSQNSNHTITTAAEDYVSAASKTSNGTGSAGTTTITGPFTSSGSGNGAGLSNTTLDPIASSNGTAGGVQILVKEYASIIGTTPPATDYTDTVTYVGAGSF